MVKGKSMIDARMLDVEDGGGCGGFRSTRSGLTRCREIGGGGSVDVDVDGDGVGMEHQIG